MKPIIGVFPSFEGEKNTLSVNKNYVNAITACGGTAYILPLFEHSEEYFDALEHIDGLLLTGGVDIAPECYGEKNNGKSLCVCPLLDKSEKLLIDLVMKKDIPVLGICRGMQALNVFYGGTLVQDIPTDIAAAEKHSSGGENAVFHNIQISKSSPLSEIMGFGTHRINSYHHQAVKKIAPDFSIAATASDGIVEAIFCTEKKFVLGVQWHPERDTKEISDNIKIISAFIKACTDSERRLP